MTTHDWNRTLDYLVGVHPRQVVPFESNRVRSIHRSPVQITVAELSQTEVNGSTGTFNLTPNWEVGVGRLLSQAWNEQIPR